MASSSRVWFVTGCSSGLGAQLALDIIGRGDKCIATARKVEQLATLKQAGADVLQFDVTASQAELDQKAKEAVALYGRVDFLINNAGYLANGSVEESTPEEDRAQFDTNVFGLLNTCRAFLPHLRAQRSGVIANVSSIGAWGGWAGTATYCASKWAVSGISESMAAELADFGIKVCCIEPGYFRSKLLNTGNRKGAGEVRRIPEYQGTAADQVVQALKQIDNHQPGDLQKGARVIVDVLSGVDGKEVPLRLALGADAYDFIKKKCEDTLGLLEEWKDFTRSTDHDDVQKQQRKQEESMYSRVSSTKDR